MEIISFFSSTQFTRKLSFFSGDEKKTNTSCLRCKNHSKCDGTLPNDDDKLHEFGFIAPNKKLIEALIDCELDYINYSNRKFIIMIVNKDKYCNIYYTVIRDRCVASKLQKTVFKGNAYSKFFLSSNKIWESS